MRDVAAPVPAGFAISMSRMPTAAAQSIADAGGTILMAPADIPESAASPCRDPAARILNHDAIPARDDGAARHPTPGAVSWHELYSSLGDKAAFDFMPASSGGRRLPRWNGPDGNYRIFGQGEVQMGGDDDQARTYPCLNLGLLYRVDAIDAAIERITANGGQIVMGPQRGPRWQRDRPGHRSAGRELRARFHQALTPLAKGETMSNIVRACGTSTTQRGGQFLRHAVPGQPGRQFVRSPADNPSTKEGAVLVVEFTLSGQPYIGLNGGPQFRSPRRSRSRCAPRTSRDRPAVGRADRHGGEESQWRLAEGSLGPKLADHNRSACST